jgi:hypothetical protein
MANLVSVGFEAAVLLAWIASFWFRVGFGARDTRVGSKRRKMEVILVLPTAQSSAALLSGQT